MVKFKVTKKRPKKPTTEKEKEQGRKRAKKHVEKLGKEVYNEKCRLKMIVS